MLGAQYSDRPGYPGRGPVYELDRHRTNRAVEALLASGLGWTLDRTVGALQRLETVSRTPVRA